MILTIASKSLDTGLLPLVRVESVQAVVVGAASVGLAPSAKQGAKSLLFKMVVIRQGVRDPVPLHGLHRYAVRKAVALVGARLVEVEPGKE